MTGQAGTSFGRQAAPVLDAAGDERDSRFLELSVFLTGFGRVQLAETGMAGTYLRALGPALARDLGQRCQGNTACTPCPVQAKYNAEKSLAQADHDRLRVFAQAVESNVLVDPVSGLPAVHSMFRLRADAAVLLANSLATRREFQ